VQYLAWIGGMARGDLGYSYVSEKPTVDETAPPIPVPAKLPVMALIFSVAVGIPLGVISAVRQNSAIDYALRVFSLTGLSMPAFWLGLLILMAFVARFGTIPIYTEPAKNLWDELLLYSVPAIAVGFRSSALIMRLTRSSMLEVLRQDYIRTARAKGFAERNLVMVHALRNAALLALTVFGLLVGRLLAGQVVVEQIFGIPGMGRVLVGAILARDFPIVQAVVLIVALSVILANLATDLTYAVLDPRIRY